MAACRKDADCCSDRCIAAIENAADRINRGGQGDAAVARQRGISAGRALPQIAMAILTMGLVDLAALPQQFVDLLRKRRGYSLWSGERSQAAISGRQPWRGRPPSSDTEDFG